MHIPNKEDMSSFCAAPVRCKCCDVSMLVLKAVSPSVLAGKTRTDAIWIRRGKGR